MYACLSVCVPHACLVPREAGGGYWILGTGVTGDCVLSSVDAGKQTQVLSTVEPALHSLSLFVYDNNINVENSFPEQIN